MRIDMPTEFASEDYELTYPEGVEDHWWHLARNRILTHELRKVTPPGSHLLDVGCGRGIAVRHFLGEGFRCIGVELGRPRPLSGLKGHLRCGIKAEELPEAERGVVDVVLLLDVVEHLADPARFLKDLSAAFPVLRLVVVAVPARPELWTNYDDLFRHYRRYTIEMIEDLAGELGWELVTRGYFFRSIYLPIRVLKEWKRPRSLAMRSPRGLFKWLHKMFSYVLVADYFLLPKAVPGTSVVAVFSLGERRVQS